MLVGGDSHRRIGGGQKRSSFISEMKLFIVLEYNSLEGTRVELSIRDLCVKVQGDVRIIPASENRFMGIPQEKRRSKNE